MPQLMTTAQETLQVWLEHTLDAFAETPEYQGLEERTQLIAEDVVVFFAEFMSRVGQVEPADWSPDVLEAVLLYEMPAHLTADVDFFLAVGPVLHAFLNWSGRTALIASTEALSVRLDAVTPRMVENASNDTNWGFAKQFAMAAWHAGVDLNDADALNHFMVQYNQSLGNEEAPRA